METELVTPGAPRPLHFVAGHPALDFANTVDRPSGMVFDHLRDYQDLVRWSVARGTIDAEVGTALTASATSDPRAARAAIRAAHRCRNAIERLFDAMVDGTDQADGWRELRPFVADGYRAAEVMDADSGGRLWSWTNTGDLATPLHPVAVAAADLLLAPDAGLVKRCANCPWLFVDRSRNHQRRWCDMNDCGRARKIELYVSRRRQRAQNRAG